MTSLLLQAVFQQSAEKLDQLPPDSVCEVAFAGRSNAGKSSALNALTGRRRLAHVSKTPGRTRLINFFTVESGSYLVDLPGYGYAQVPGDMRRHWARLLTGYLNERRQICGLVVVMDARHPMTPLDRQLLDWFAATGKPVHVLLTKADKLSRSQAGAQLQKVQATLRKEFAGCSVQLFSSSNKLGVEDAQQIICQWLSAGG
ncbi:MAG TPA: ribosome biogenesis GTP-binding protein YihA/YsxC [Burkholderiales bacterium]|nr:ribosome biogenesis GTP-binding protein YihA/YsxC [Burkholderiales bacterium]